VGVGLDVCLVGRIRPAFKYTLSDAR